MYSRDFDGRERSDLDDLLSKSLAIEKRLAPEPSLAILRNSRMRGVLESARGNVAGAAKLGGWMAGVSRTRMPIRNAPSRPMMSP